MCFIKVGDLNSNTRNENNKTFSKQKKKELVKSVLNRNGLMNRVNNIIKYGYSNK